MQENVGNRDRTARFVIGGGLVAAGLVAGLRKGGLAAAALASTGVVLLETAITRVCPMNALLHIDTRGLDGSPRQVRGKKNKAARAPAGPAAEH